MSTCIAAHTNSLMTYLPIELDQMRRRVPKHLPAGTFTSQLHSGRFLHAGNNLLLPCTAPQFILGTKKTTFLSTSPDPKQLQCLHQTTRVPEMNTQQSWTIEACSTETPSRPDARNEFQPEENSDPHISCVTFAKGSGCVLY